MYHFQPTPFSERMVLSPAYKPLTQSVRLNQDTSIQIPNDWKKQGVRGSRGIPDTSTRLPTKTEYLTRDFPSYPQSAYTSQIYPYDHFSTNHSDIVAPSPHHDRPRPQPNSTQMQAHLSPQYVPHPPSSPTVSLKITTRSSPPPSPPSTQSALIARRNLARSAQLESKYHNRFQTRRVDEMLRYFQPDDLDADQAFSSETSAFLGSKQPLPPQVPRTSHSTSSRADRASHRSAFERYLSQAQHLPRQRALRSSSADQPRRRGPSFAAERLKYTDRTSPPQTRFVPDRQFSPHELDPLYSSFSASRVFSPRAMKGWREKEKIRKGRTVRRRESTTLSETSPRRASVKSDHSSTLHSLLPVVSSPRDVPLSALPPSAFPCPVSPRSSSSPAPHATAPPFNSSQLYFTPPFSPSTTLKPSSTLLSSSFLPSNPFSPQYPSRALQTPSPLHIDRRTGTARKRRRGGETTPKDRPPTADSEGDQENSPQDSPPRVRPLEHVSSPIRSPPPDTTAAESSPSPSLALSPHTPTTSRVTSADHSTYVSPSLLRAEQIRDTHKHNLLFFGSDSFS